jgi:hypothetical protein
MRPATPEEQDAIGQAFEAIERGLWAKVAGSQEPAVAVRDGIAFATLAPRELLDLPAALLEGAEAGGLPIGTLEDGSFHLDLQGAVLASRHTRAQTVRVAEHAAQLFLYGRNILGDSVLFHDPRLQRGDACIVANPRGEAVGIGVVVGSFKGRREAVKPVHDLGAYLRDQDEG